MDDEEVIAISKTRYQELIKAEDELTALYAGGVDNWEGCNFSLHDNKIFEIDGKEVSFAELYYQD